MLEEQEVSCFVAIFGSQEPPMVSDIARSSFDVQCIAGLLLYFVISLIIQQIDLFGVG